MFRPFTLTYLAGCLASVFRLFGFWLGVGLLSSSFTLAKKVTPSVIVASIEGEVSSLNLEDEFKVQLGPTTVGKKINPKTLLTTGKTGKVTLLFSNGTLITIKPGSRFYLRTYKQLEGIVEGSVDPGKLEEEPTQSELSAHLDFGDLVVKAPKLKKGSSMKLTSPLGTAGIRGTMFQLMAVRNSVTGDIMGGINLISGDIDFSDTGGNTVSLLSGQSIQLATSKLGAPVASQTGELVDLASTYGPALTDGFAPPPLESVFVNYSELGPSNPQESTSSDNMFPPMPAIARTSISSVNSAQGWEMIHELATDLFFEIESAETVAAGFTFESMALAPTIDIPTPEPEAPVAPPSITGETLAGADLEFFQGGHPELKLLGTNNSTDPLVKIFNNGARMQVEMRAPSEGITWRKIDPWVQALDFLGNDITSGVQLTGAPKILLANPNSAESEAPPPGSSVFYEVSYSIRDLRGLNTVIFRQVDVVATRPSIEIAEKTVTMPLSEPSYSTFFQWINSIVVEDVRGNRLPYKPDKSLEGFYLDGSYDLDALGTSATLSLVATDWRGLTSRLSGIKISVVAAEPIVDGDTSFSTELSDEIIRDLLPPLTAFDEFDRKVDNIELSKVVSKSNNSLIDINSEVFKLKRGEMYEFTYLFTDSRNVETTKSIDFYVTVSSPTLHSSDFNSSFVTANQPGFLEYGDPEQELDEWLSQANANDFNGNPLDVTFSIAEDGIPRSLAQLKSQNPYNGSDNSKLYTISFSTEDPRWKSGSTHQSWEPYLKITNSHELDVAATPPKLELFFHEPRAVMPEINHDNNIISFLVRSKGDYKDLEAFQDDGNFAISPDPGEGNRDSRKLYYKATAYDGLGDEITHLNLVEVDGVDAVDSETLNSDSKITLSINDQTIRGSEVNGGAESKIIYTVSIVDVISPLISVIDHEDPIEGIMPEIRLLSGSLKDQVQGNSDEQYYFPDPGLVIRDNYYTEEEIRAHNNISIDNEYVFDYVYDTDKKIYESVWEFPNRDLDISVVGTYEVFYSLNDPSGNLSKNYNQPDSDEVSRLVNVVDSRAPIVKLYGSSTMYVDLQSIIDEETRYSDPGAYAIENLYVAGDGLFDWKTSDSELSWDVSFSLCNDLENDTYDDPIRFIDGSDLIESTIQGYLNDPSSLPSEAIRFKVTYALEDKSFLDNSANRGEANRTVELRGSPNLYSHIYFVLNHPEHREGDPLSPASTIDGTKAVLPTLVWSVEVGIDQFSSAPDAIVFNDLGGDLFEHVQYSTQLLFLDENNISSDQVPSYSFNLANYLQKVNYWDLNADIPNYVQFNESTGFYDFYEKGNPNWKRVVIRYTSAKNELGNYSIRDLEIRLKDESPPSITIDTQFDESIPIEVGEVFERPTVETFDSASSFVTLTPEIKGEGLSDDHNSTFEELEDRGFWKSGEFVITYTAVDEFLNETETSLNLLIKDTIAPHLAVIDHETFYDFDFDKTFSQLHFVDEENPSAPYLSRLSSVFGSSSISWSDFYSQGEFLSETPYLEEDENGSGFYLKASEVNLDGLDIAKTITYNQPSQELDDDFGRTYAWLSPFSINFNNFGTPFYDPGLLIYEPSSDELSYSVEVIPTYKNNNNQAAEFAELENQISTITLNVTVSQNGTSLRREIKPFRTYTFLDDFNPLISVSPETNENDRFIMVEAGFPYDDENQSGDGGGLFDIWNDNNVIVQNDVELKVTAYDVTDGDLTSSIVRTVTDLNDNPVSLRTGSGYVNNIYKIRYDVSDFAEDPGPNAAEPKYRFLVVKDTTAPLIFPLVVEGNVDNSDSNISDYFELDYFTDPKASDLEALKTHLLSGLVAYDYGKSGALGEFSDITIDQDLSWWEDSEQRAKWTVEIKKPDTDENDPGGEFMPGVVYPFEKSDPGYNVTITVEDKYGNKSEPRLRTLKISDKIDPVVKLIGSSEIHDFLRFSKNDGLSNNELLFDDRNFNETENPKFDSSGFGGGAHRIILSDYAFVDPGAYAHDFGSYFRTSDGYKNNYGNDDFGETYAMRRVSERSYMVNCDDENPDSVDIGVIFTYSVLEKVSNPTKHFQNLMASDDFGLDTTDLSETNATFPPGGGSVALSSVKVPDVDNQPYDFNTLNKDVRTNLDVTKILIEYRVKDGWGNFSNIEERTVYIYESRQFDGFAFYATPITDGNGVAFEDYYDNNTSGAYLKLTRKDTDGDGVSDYWEKVFGSNPLDRNSVPKDEQNQEIDFSDPQTFINNSLSFDPLNSD